MPVGPWKFTNFFGRFGGKTSQRTCRCLCWKYLNNKMFWNILVAFLQSVLLKENDEWFIWIELYQQKVYRKRLKGDELQKSKKLKSTYWTFCNKLRFYFYLSLNSNFIFSRRFLYSIYQITFLFWITREKDISLIYNYNIYTIASFVLVLNSSLQVFVAFLPPVYFNNLPYSNFQLFSIHYSKKSSEMLFRVEKKVIVISVMKYNWTWVCPHRDIYSCTSKIVFIDLFNKYWIHNFHSMI